MNLSLFAQKESLYEASKQLFKNLGFNINGNTDAYSLKEILAVIAQVAEYKMDSRHAELLKELQTAYFVGILDQESLNREVWYSIDEAKKGKYKDGMAVIAIDWTREEAPKKADLAALVRMVNRNFEKDPIVVLVRYQKQNMADASDPTHIAIGLPYRRARKKRTHYEGEVVEKVSLIKDIDINHTHRGHIEILKDLSATKGKSKITDFDTLYEAWLKVFDLKTLNDKFFKEIANWFFWASKTVEFPQIRPKNEMQDPESYQQESVIRLLTRFLFCWFLKEKGFIKNEVFDKKYLQNILPYFSPEAPKSDLFDKKSKDLASYYKAILQNLFFATLSKKMDEREYISDKKGKNGYSPEYGNAYAHRYKELFNDENQIKILFENVPFLNGGLFECLDKTSKTDDTLAKSEEIRLDGFSTTQKKQAKVPDFLFFGHAIIDLSKEYGSSKYSAVEVNGLINALNQYKFTIEENTPLEEEVALDPELLGKIFENLLAFYNPETAQTARKSSGSFYTPREIVEYMVEQSLLAYLNSPLTPEGGTNSQQHKQYNTLNELINDFTNTPPSGAGGLQGREAIIKKLLQIKILDPACGSGAFPMGILHKLVDIFRAIDPKNEDFKKVLIENTRGEEQKQIEQLKADKELVKQLSDQQIAEQAKKAIDAKIAEIEKDFNDSLKTDDYSRKLYIIQNCIFGVDIQNIAIQISKLRFFLSLVIEQNPQSKKDLKEIKALPNLETKFVCANTLIGLEKTKADLFNTQLLDLEKQLLANRSQYFYTQHYEDEINKETKEIISIGKKTLQAKDKKLREEIAKMLQKDKNISAATAQKLITYDIFSQNSKADFFDMEWMFGVKTGFDVVIGNPPYVQIQSLKKEAFELQKQNYATYTATADLYCVFYERGVQLLKEKGILCFITSNKWLQANYGQKTRKFLVEKTNPLQLIDFGKFKIFESATVFVNILLTQKAKNQHQTQALKLPDDYELEKNNLTDFFKQSHTILKDLGEDTWRVVDELKNAINQRVKDKSKFKLLKELSKVEGWKVEFYAGIKTALNDAFHIDEATRNQLIAQDPKNADIIKPLLRGKDIKRWKYQFEGLHIINSHNGVREKNIQRIDIVKNYPSILEHLERYLPAVKERQDRGEHWTNLRNCAFLLEFEKPKIVWIEISDKANYAYDESGMYLTNSAYFLTGENLKYLLAILNSKVADYFFFQVTAQIAGGRKRYTSQYVGEVPIPILPKDRQKPFETFVDYILFLKSQGEEYNVYLYYFEQVLNGMVYELFFEDLLQKAGRLIIRYVLGLPQINLQQSEKALVELKNLYEHIHHKDHPIRNAVFFMDSIPEIREIENVTK